MARSGSARHVFAVALLSATACATLPPTRGELVAVGSAKQVGGAMMGAAGVAAILGAGPLIAIGAISEPDNGGAIAAGVITGLLGVALTGLGVQEYTAGGRMIARSVDEEASTPAAPPPESDAVPGRPVPDD